MKQLITQEEVFNEEFETSKCEADFSGLLNFTISKKYIPEKEAGLIFEKYKKYMFGLIMSEYEYDEDEDINLEIENKVSAYFDAINNLLISMKNPYQAIRRILDDSPTLLISEAKDKYGAQQIEIQKQAILLKQKAQILYDNNHEFKMLIDYIFDRIKKATTRYPLYRLMDGRDYINIKTLDDLDLLVKQISIEVDIAKKFKINEIVRMLKSFDAITDVSKNITETAMYNYVFNSFYKDGESIEFTENMKNIIIRDIRMGMFSTEDIIDIIKNGTIKFSEVEEEYLLNYFVRRFEIEIINNKYIDRFVKTK